MLIKRNQRFLLFSYAPDTTYDVIQRSDRRMAIDQWSIDVTAFDLDLSAVFDASLILVFPLLVRVLQRVFHCLFFRKNSDQGRVLCPNRKMLNKACPLIKELKHVVN